MHAPFPSNTAFFAYAVTALLLCANLIFLWGYSGFVRGKTKVAINPEDAKRFHAPLQESEPPEVARVLRAHANAQAMVYPFLVLGLIFVLEAGDGTLAWAIFGVFTVSRYCHSFFYLRALQPYRTISFVLGGVAIVVLMANVLVRLLNG